MCAVAGLGRALPPFVLGHTLCRMSLITVDKFEEVSILAIAARL